MNRHSAAGGSGPQPPGNGGGDADANPKRARILDAAVRVFAEKGFYNAKVSEIARVAGVADGTIYLYFKSKDDLLISIFEDRMTRVNDQIRAALALGRTPAEKLRQVVVTHFSLVERDPQLAEVLTVELRQSAKFIKEYKHSRFGEFLKLLAEPIVAGQEDGSFRADIDAPIAARALFGAMDDLALAWVLRPGAQGTPGTKPGNAARRDAALEPSRMAAQLADLFIAGLVRENHGRGVAADAEPPAIPPGTPGTTRRPT